jgi:hypothetical protein
VSPNDTDVPANGVGEGVCAAPAMTRINKLITTENAFRMVSPFPFSI